MGYFYDTYMANRRNQWLRSIHHVEVQTNGSWHKGHIDQKKVDGDTLTILVTVPELDDKACTITASRVIDTRGEVAAQQQRAIKKVAGQGTMVKITIPIYEVTA